jgi:hypothetical protein
VLDLPDPSGTGTLPGVIGTNLFTDRDMVLNLQNNSAWAGITEQWKWNTDANATWNSSTNWTLATVPNGTDMQANFTDAIHADRTVTVSTDVSVGSIAFDNAFRYMINGPGRITMSVAATGDSAQLNVVSGSHTINALMTFASDVIANIQSDSSTLTISSDVIATNKSISKEGPGTLEMKNVRAGGLLVDAGKVLITPNATAAGASKIGSISFGTATLITGKLDLTNNALAVDYTGSSPVPDIRAFLQSGYAGGAWTGPGITSSHAAAIAADSSNTHKTAIGFAEASAIGNPASWFGQSVDGSSLLMRYTFSGDANLDGHVNSGDFTALAQNFNGANRFWRQGDFNFDGTVNALDFNMIATNFGQVMTSEALGALVPEPGTIAIVILPALLLRRRRDAAPRLA